MKNKIPFDPQTLDIKTMIETNNRLNRRCQKLERLVAKYRRRYVSIQKPAQQANRDAEVAWKRSRELLNNLWNMLEEQKSKSWWERLW